MSNVVLTLISIIIALGIEHLLGHVSGQFRESHGAARFLIAAQGVATFATIGAIWVAYATQLMTAAWEPRFQDFFAPLFILSLLYFWISAIGDRLPAWFHIGAVGWAVAFPGNRFALPRSVAKRLRPGSLIASRSIFSHLGLCMVSAGGGAATQVGVLGATGASALVCVLAVVQLSAAWFQFQWWRAA